MVSRSMKVYTNRYFEMNEGRRKIVWKRIYNFMCDRRQENLLVGLNIPLEHFFDTALFEAEIGEHFALCQALVDTADFYEIY